MTSEAENSRGALLRRIPQIQTGAPASPGADEHEDKAAELCRRWREVDFEARELVLRWQRLETRLFKQSDWPKLTVAEQRRVIDAEPLFAIDERLSKLHTARQDLLPLIQAFSAVTRSGALSKLEVLESVLDLTNSPEAQALLKSAYADIDRLWT